MYLPWVSYAYQKLYAALVNAGQMVKEQLFGNYQAVTLSNGTSEYTLSTILSRFTSPIKFEILYGASGDQRVRLRPMRSIAKWDNQANVSTNYQPKTDPIYYLLQDKIGIVPTPPSTDTINAILYAWYIKGPFRITDATDVIDIPYRYIYPLLNYVQAKAIEKQFEDYKSAALIEAKFERELEQIAESASNEYNENDPQGVEIDPNSPLNNNPLTY